MIDKNSWDGKNDEFETELDAALAKLTAAQPRAGLEQRILANLQAERTGAGYSATWRWPFTVGPATPLLVAATLVVLFGSAVFLTKSPAPKSARKSQRSELPRVRASANQTQPGNLVDSRPVFSRAANEQRPGVRAVKVARVKMTSAPRRDQFPSPQPLSAQEKMLMEYVAAHRSQAVLVARARMAALKQDMADEIFQPSPGSGSSEESALEQEN